VGPVAQPDERLSQGDRRWIGGPGGHLPQGHECQHAEGGNEDDRALHDPRRDEAQGGALVLSLDDREQRHGRADAGHRGDEVEEGAEQDLVVRPGGECLARVLQHRVIEE
jgi:hypothetical protein